MYCLGPRGRRRLVLLLALLSEISAVGQAATTAVGYPLEAALRELEGRGLRVVYSSELVRPGMRVDSPIPGGDLAAGELPEILAALLAPHGLKAVPGPGGSWLVVPAAAGRGEVAGRVHSREGEPLAAVRVIVLGSGAAARTGDDGSFRIPELEPGTYVLEARLPGFVVERSEDVGVVAGGTVEVRFELAPAPVAIDQIIVTPSHFEMLKNDPESRQFLSRSEVRRLPHIADDLYRAMSWLPGTAGSDLSASFHVRGGEPGEILVLLDGVELHQPFHLRDLNYLSSIDAEAISGVELMSGGFPVEYGDRMSAVIDMSTRVAPKPRLTSLGLSTMSARLLSSGTFRDQRGQWLVSARHTYLDLLLELAGEDGIDPALFDLLGRTQYQLNQSTVAAINVQADWDDLDHFEDDGEVEEVDAESESFFVWSSLDSLWTPRLSSRTVLSFGSQRRDQSTRVEEFEFSGLAVEDRSSDVAALRQSWSFEVGQRQLLKWGFEAEDLRADWHYDGRSTAFDPLYTLGGPPIEKRNLTEAARSGNTYGAYFADRFQLSDDLTAELGVRWDRQTHTGGDQVSPRFNVAYSLGDDDRYSILRAAWGQYHQSQDLRELQVMDGETRYFPAQRAEHRLISFEHGFPARRGQSRGSGPPRRRSLRLEVYDKLLSDPRPRFENLFNAAELLLELRPDRVLVTPRRARARGFELVLKTQGGAPRSRSALVDWWLSYANASVKDDIDGVWIPRSWDQRHTVAFSLSYRLWRKWQLNLAGIFHTGWPVTRVDLETVRLADGTIEFRRRVGPRNGDNYDPFNRLDLRLSRRFPSRYGEWTVFFEAMNLLGHNNPRSLESFYLTFSPVSGQPSLVAEENFGLPFLPSFGVAWEL